MARCTATFEINKGLWKLRTSEGWHILMREALWNVARWWHKKILPEHFKVSAPSRYPGEYTPRSRKHRARKRKNPPDRRGPMVFTGKMRRTILRGLPTRQEFKAGGATRIRLRLPFARVVNLWNGRRVLGWSDVVHNFPAELAAMNAKDHRAINKRLDRVAGFLLRRQLAVARMKKTRVAERDVRGRFVRWADSPEAGAA